GMQDDLVADGDVVANGGGRPARCIRSVVGSVDHAAVLNAGTRTDADAIDVAADHRRRPYRRILAEGDITNDDGRIVDKGTGRDGRLNAVKGADHDNLRVCCSSRTYIVLHCKCSLKAGPSFCSDGRIKKGSQRLPFFDKRLRPAPPASASDQKRYTTFACNESILSRATYSPRTSSCRLNA